LHVLSVEEVDAVSGGVPVAAVVAVLTAPVSAPVAAAVIGVTLGAAIIGGRYYLTK
jgi:hypothetical protein